MSSGASSVRCRVDRDETERYWAARPRGHRVGVWASPQSHPIDADVLDACLAEVEGRFAGQDLPSPAFWGGYVVGVDELLELWQGRTDRLHHRAVYRRERDRIFTREQLAP